MACVLKTTSFPGVVVLAAALAAGCNGRSELPAAGGGDAIVAAPLGALSIYQLAGRLDMKVQHSSRASASLRDVVNSVTIFSDPGGQVFVNGRALRGSGGIVSVGEILFLPAALEPDIRMRLRIPPPAPRPRPSRRPPGPARMRGTVVIDPGHGGRDPGAIAPSGLQEKVVNLGVARGVVKLLRQRGLSVTLTRSGDSFVELNERAAIANRLRADLFVSIHADSAASRSARGYTVYLARSASSASLTLGGALERRLRAANARSRGIRRADFRVLVRTACPAALVELGYLSNAAESARLGDPNYQRQLAGAVAAGIVEFMGRLQPRTREQK